MSRFDTNPQKLRNQAARFKAISADIKVQQWTVGDVTSVLSGMNGMGDVVSALNTTSTNIRNMSRRTEGYGTALSSIITNYDITEQNILGQGESTLGNGVSYWATRGFKVLRDGATWLGYEVGFLNGKITSKKLSDRTIESSIKPKDLNKDIKDKLKDDGKYTEYKSEKNGIYDKESGDSYTEKLDANGKPMKDANGKKLYEKKDKNGNVTEVTEDDVEKFYKREQTLAEYKVAEIKAEGSLIDAKVNIGDSGTIEAKVGAAEAHAGVSAGMYVIGADGTKKLSPGVSAEIGASVTALEVAWDQQWLGDENLGFSTDAKVTVGQAKAKAGANLQIFGQDGKLDAQANFEASAEAIAWKAEGTAKLDILGGDVGVKGSVQFGVGAHANVGLHDGKFQVDIGASLGIGASVGFEVDVGGMVNTVWDSASSAWDGLVSGWNSIFGK